MPSLKVIFSSPPVFRQMCVLTHIPDQQGNPIAVLAVLLICLRVARKKCGKKEKEKQRQKN